VFAGIEREGRKPRQAKLQAAILPVPFHRIPPPKESMKESVENRRLLTSILVPGESAIYLE
jgi:hypothetical protein